MLIDAKNMGAMDFGDLPRQWRRLDLIRAEVQKVVGERLADSFDPRQIDEGRLGGHRLYGTVEKYLAIADDCHKALPLLLSAHGATNAAMWALLRSQFESSFYALWLLSPRESRERVLRGIRVHWLDDRLSNTYATELLKDPVATKGDEQSRASGLKYHERLQKEHAATYEAESQANGARWKRPPDVNMVLELTKLEDFGQPGAGAELRAAWRTLAGLQHGNSCAQLRVSDMEFSGTSQTGVREAIVSPNDSSFQYLGGVTATLTKVALARYALCHQPMASAAPIDLNKVLDWRRRWDRA